VTVDLKNGGSSVAFFLHLRAVKAGTDEEIAPIFWSDNFVSLMPGDSRTLTVTGLPDAKEEVEIRLDGWNVEARTLRIAATQ
jgi:hypothetical protein